MATTLLALLVTGPLLGLVFNQGSWAEWTSGYGRFISSVTFIVPITLIAAFLFLSPVVWPSEAWARRVRARLAGGRPAKEEP
ncbi:hypothetical protein [Streptomyces sp. NPDC093109]|uniref:hypothetical protein n=1 Tax=Streptomyces sp. NPDC093109 TaxID=3154977 RepID=UPI00344FDD10